MAPEVPSAGVLVDFLSDPPLFISLRFFSRLDGSLSRTRLRGASGRVNSLACSDQKLFSRASRETCGLRRIWESHNASPSSFIFGVLAKSFSACQLSGNTAGRTRQNTSPTSNVGVDVGVGRRAHSRGTCEFSVYQNYFPGKASCLISIPYRFLSPRWYFIPFSFFLVVIEWFVSIVPSSETPRRV